MYDNTFGMTSESMTDESVFTAGFGKSKKSRMLKETDKDKEDESEVSKMAYTPKIKTHNSNEIKIAIEFDDPE